MDSADAGFYYNYKDGISDRAHMDSSCYYSNFEDQLPTYFYLFPEEIEGKIISAKERRTYRK